MYAIVEIAGQQFKVEKEQEIFVHRLEGDTGSSVEFENVLLLDNAGKVSIGTPTVNGAMIKAKILEHLKGDKVMVFHKKRRKGYQKENGHRQFFSKIVIEDILTSVKKAEKKTEAAPKAVKKTEAAPKAEKKTAAAPKAKKKTETAPKAVAEAKPKAAPKAAAKKPAEKKEVKAEKKAAAPKSAKKEVTPKAEKKAEPKKGDDDKKDK